MADYYTSTVVQQAIPHADITPLEMFLLENIFENSTNGDVVYFYSPDGTNDTLYLNPAELREALAQSQEIPSSIYPLVKAQLDNATPGAEEIDIDLSIVSWEFILQDIVKRSKTLTRISVMVSFVCSKMRADGFGGMITLITPETILATSTTEILEKWLADEFP